MSTEPPERRWFQFRLRTLFILMAVFAVPLAWLAHERSKVRARLDWLESLKTRAVILYGQGPRDQPAWLRMLLGDDSPGDIATIRSGYITDDDLAQLPDCPKLINLDIDNSQVTNAGLVHLAGLADLQWLDLDHSQVTDAGLIHLVGLTGLTGLDLMETQVTDAGLVHLAGLSQLRTLDLNTTKVTDAGLVHLAGLTQLRNLSLYRTQVTDSGVQKLKRVLPNLGIDW